jgi:E3 ubiquitin-protein ligase BRE1
MGGHKRKRSLIGAEAGADGNGKGEEGKTTREAQLTAALDTLQELKHLVATRGEELMQLREEKMELNRRITSLAGPGLVDEKAGKSAPEKQEGGGIGCPGRLSEEQLVRQPLYQSLRSERDNLRRESQMKERQVLSLRQNVGDLEGKVHLLGRSRQAAVEAERGHFISRTEELMRENQSLRRFVDEHALEMEAKRVLVRQADELKVALAEERAEASGLRAITTHQAAELKEARSQWSQLQEQLKAREDEAKRLSEQVLAPLGADEAREGRLAELTRQLEEAQGEKEGLGAFQTSLFQETESLTAAYEKLSESTQRLKQQVEEKEKRNNRLQDELLKSKATEQMQVERASALERRQQDFERLRLEQTATVKELQELVELLRTQCAGLAQTRREAEEGAQADAEKLHQAQREADEAAQSLREFQNKLQAMTSRAEDLSRELDKVERERFLLREEVGSLTRKLQKVQVKIEPTQGAGAGGMGLNSATGGGREAAQNETLLKLLNCSVCNVRWKDCVITKCYHLFCQPCIQSNLKVRSRKCPACGKHFSENDVKPIFLT